MDLRLDKRSGGIGGTDASIAEAHRRALIELD
jgi:hypothetical protein